VPGDTCWNFANGFGWRARQQGLNAWVLIIYTCDGRSSHAAGIIQTDSAVPGASRFCVVEPQDNSVVACWTQPGGPPPVVPDHVKRTLEAFYSNWVGGPVRTSYRCIRRVVVQNKPYAGSRN
jgi:hypothetical protein